MGIQKKENVMEFWLVCNKINYFFVILIMCFIIQYVLINDLR